MRRYLGAARWYFVVGVIFLLATNVLALRIPRLLGNAVETLRVAVVENTALDMAFIRTTAIAVILLAIGSALTRIGSRIAIFNGGRHVEYVLRNELFEHLLTLGPEYFEEEATGDLVSRVINDVNYVRLMYGLGILHLVNTAVAYTMVLGLMFALDARLTLLCLAPFPVVLFTIRLFTRALYKHQRRTQEQLSEISAVAQENLSGAAVVRAFAIEHESEDRFKKTSEEYVERNLALARIRGAMFPYMGAVAGLGTLMVLYFGGTAVIDKHISLGQFVEFSAYLVALAWPTMAMGWVLSVWHRGRAGFDRLVEILDTRTTIPEPDAPLQLKTPEGAKRGEIVFQNVSLTFSDGTQALRDINLRIPAGSTVAIVGRTGAGKSSLVDLIPRMRDPSGGKVLIDGVPANEAALVDLRSYVAYAPQSPFLFSTTVEENIRMGVLAREELGLPPSEGAPELEDALRISHFAGDLSVLTNGLDTMVGERGVTLSGGQKQRVTIARAVMLDPAILILDDSLASVDTQTERAILEELLEVMDGRTSILVTHRFNALEVVDEIIVLEEGRIVERGTHSELADAGGVYAELLERQRLEAEMAA